MTVSLLFYSHFVASGAAATGLTVTIDVDTVAKSNGARNAIVTAGAATEGANGYYYYRYATADLATYDYVGVFKTTGTADVKAIPSLWSNYSINVDVAIAAIPTTAAPTTAAIRAEMDDHSTKLANLDAAVTTRAPDSVALAENGDLFDNDWLADVNDTTGLYAIPSINNKTTAFSAGQVMRIEDEEMLIVSTTRTLPFHTMTVIRAFNGTAVAAHSGGVMVYIVNTANMANVVKQVWDEPLSEHTTLGTAGETLVDIQTQLIAIGNGVVTVVSPVGTNHALALVAGDDYYATDGRSLDYTSTGWPDMSGATITFMAHNRVDESGTRIAVTGIVMSATSIRVELSSAQTAQLGTGRGEYSIYAALDTTAHQVTLVSGTISLAGR